jgi:hypothetical protein
MADTMRVDRLCDDELTAFVASRTWYKAEGRHHVFPNLLVAQFSASMRQDASPE